MAASRFLLWSLLVPLVSAQEAVLRAVSIADPPTISEYCIFYNKNWTSLPSTLTNITYRRLEILTPTLLCSRSDVTHDIKDKAIVVSRGNCTFVEKGEIAASLGAKMLLVASDDGISIPYGNRTPSLTIPVVLIRNENIIELKETLGKNVVVTLYSPPLPTFDYSIVVIFAIAVLCVTLGGYWSGMTELAKLKKTSSSGSIDSSKSEENVTLTPVTVVLFVATCSVMLVLMYYFYKWLVYFVIAVFCISSAMSLYCCLAALLKKIPYGRCSWAWILQDILGIAFCVHFIKSLKMPNFKSCVILLGLLLVYDVFFVFITPFITKSGESIMVEVAVGPFENSEKLPVVIKVPRMEFSAMKLCYSPFSLLGFGDIVVPGLLIAYCHRFDVQTSSSSVYFISSIISYSVGMLITFVSLALMRMAQPALLYLVPCTLITTTLVALYRKEIKKFWNGNSYQVMDPIDSAANEGNPTEASEQQQSQ